MYRAYLTPFRSGLGELVQRAEPLNIACDAISGTQVEPHERAYELPNGSTMIGRMWPLPLAENRISRTHGEINFSESAGILTITAKSMNPIFVKTLPVKKQSNTTDAADTQSLPLIRGPSQLTPAASQESANKAGTNTSVTSDKSGAPPAPFSPLIEPFTPVASPVKAVAPNTPIVPTASQLAHRNAPGGLGFGISSLNSGVSRLLRVASHAQMGGGLQIRGIVDGIAPNSQNSLTSTPNNTPQAVATAPLALPPIADNTTPQTYTSAELGALEGKTPWTTVLPKNDPYIARFGESGILLVSFIGIHGGPQYQVHIIKVGTEQNTTDVSAFGSQDAGPTQVLNDDFKFQVPLAAAPKPKIQAQSPARVGKQDSASSLQLPTTEKEQKKAEKVITIVDDEEEEHYAPTDSFATPKSRKKRKADEISPVPEPLSAFSDLNRSRDSAKKRKEVESDQSSDEDVQERHRFDTSFSPASPSVPSPAIRSRKQSKDVMPPPAPQPRQLFGGLEDEDDDAEANFDEIHPVEEEEVVMMKEASRMSPPPAPAFAGQQSRIVRMDVADSLPVGSLMPSNSAFMDTDNTSPPSLVSRRSSRLKKKLTKGVSMMKGVSELDRGHMEQHQMEMAIDVDADGQVNSKSAGEGHEMAISEHPQMERGQGMEIGTLDPVHSFSGETGHHRALSSSAQHHNGGMLTEYGGHPHVGGEHHAPLRRLDTLTPSIDVTQLRVLQTIGSGSCGEVYKATWLGLNVAVKKVFRSLIHESALYEFQAECNIMKRLRHPNIVLFLGITKPPDQNHSLAAEADGMVDVKSTPKAQLLSDSPMCLVTEFMPLGSLHEVLMNPNTTVDLMAILKMATDAAMGVNYLHQLTPPIIHRDLKSHNLLVGDNFVVKVTDFGLAKITSSADDAHMTFCGTLPWAAPEVLSGAGYTVKADVYSFGVVLWELITRQEPYKGLHKPDIIVGVVNNQLRPPLFPDMEPLIVELIQACWAQDPAERPDFQQIVDRLGEVTDFLYNQHQQRRTAIKLGAKLPDKPSSLELEYGSKWLASHAPGSLDHHQQVTLANEARESPMPDNKNTLEAQFAEALQTAAALADATRNQTNSDGVGSDERNGRSLRTSDEAMRIHREALEALDASLQSGDMDSVFSKMEALRMAAEEVRKIVNSSGGSSNRQSWASVPGSGPQTLFNAPKDQSTAAAWTLDLNELTSVEKLPEEPSPSFATRSRHSLNASGARSGTASENTSISLTSTESNGNAENPSEAPAGGERNCTSWHGLFRGQDVLVRVWHEALEQAEVREFHKQLDILASVKSSRVALFYGCVLEPRLLMVTEYIPHPTLYALMTADPATLPFAFDWDVVILAALEIAKSISSLHLWQPCIVHRDIQSSKFVFDPRTWRVKMNDLGLARFATASNQSTLAKVRGNFLYTAPEAYSGSAHAPASDVYSFGILLWELVMRCISGRYVQPFSEFSSIRFEFQLVIQVSKQAIRPSLHPDTPEPLKQLICACWSQEPDARPPMQDVVLQLEQLKELYEQETRANNA